jgi:hypothetical protein
MPNEESALAAKLSNWELVTLACYRLGGIGKLIHTEDVALEAFRLAPNRFCWKKHAEYPDLDIVRVSLTDAAKTKYGNLVSGSKDSGWSVTRSGMTWAEDFQRREPGLFDQGLKSRAANRTDRAAAFDREADLIRKSTAYSKWKRDLNELTVYDFFAATRTSSYLPPRQMKLRHAQLAQLLAEDKELVALVDHLFEQFGDNYQAEVQ